MTVEHDALDPSAFASRVCPDVQLALLLAAAHDATHPLHDAYKAMVMQNCRRQIERSAA